MAARGILDKDRVRHVPHNAAAVKMLLNSASGVLVSALHKRVVGLVSDIPIVCRVLAHTPSRPAPGKARQPVINANCYFNAVILVQIIDHLLRGLAASIVRAAADFRWHSYLRIQLFARFLGMALPQTRQRRVIGGVLEFDPVVIRVTNKDSHDLGVVNRIVIMMNNGDRWSKRNKKIKAQKKTKSMRGGGRKEEEEESNGKEFFLLQQKGYVQGKE